MIVRPNSPAPLTDEWKVMDEHERVNTPEDMKQNGNKFIQGQIPLHLTRP